MSAVTPPIAVIGATGQQGGAVVAALLGRGARVRAVVRNAEKARALAAEEAVEIAVADLADAAALTSAFAGVAAVFAMTTMTGPTGTDGEVENGRTIADAAKAAGVPQLVYSSVGGAERNTGIPHFESKWLIEQYLGETGVPTVFVRPTYFMDNFLTGSKPVVQDGAVVLRAPLSPGVALQMIAVADIGAAAASALLDPAAIPGGAVEIAGDELTPERIAEVFGAQAGLPGRFEPVPIDALGDDDLESMFHWFARIPAYQADFALTRQLVGQVTDLKAFAAEHPVIAA